MTGLRVLVVRPERQAAATARKLSALGHVPLVSPVLHIEPTGDAPPAGSFDALVVTSRNAVRALAATHGRWAGLPVFAVGRRTAGVLASEGFPDVRHADGAGADLARLVAEACRPKSSLLLVGGRHRKPEPAATLKRAGFRVAVWESYSAEPVDTLPPAIAAALRQGGVDACLHYSKRSAGTLVRLCGEAGLLGRLTEPAHVCLSEDVAFALRAVAAPRIVVAPEPDEAALLAALSAAGDAPRQGSHPAEAEWYARNESGSAGLPGRSRKPAPMSDTSRDKRRRDPYARKPPTIELKSADFKRADDARAGERPDPIDPGAEVVAEAGASAEAVGLATAAASMAAAQAHARAAPDRSTPEPAPPADRAAPSPDETAAPDPIAPGAEALPAENLRPAGVADETPGAAIEVESPAGETRPGASADEPAGPMMAAAETDVTHAAADGASGETAAGLAGDGKTEAAPASAPAVDLPSSDGSGPIVLLSEPSGSARSAAEAREGASAPGATDRAAAATGPDERRSSVPPIAPPPARRGAGSLIGAGLLGGVIGAALATGADYALRPPQTGLETRLSALERRPAPTPAPAGPDRATSAAVEALTARVGAVEAASRPLADQIGSVRQAADDAAAAARQASEAAGKVQAPPPDPAVTAALGELAQRLTAVEGQAKAALPAASLEERLAPFGEAARLGTANSGAITDLRTRFDTLAADTAGKAQAATAATTALGARLGAVETRVAALADEQAKLPPALMQAGLRLVAAGQAIDALRTGQPLGPSLAALGRLGVPASQAAALQPYAGGSAPTAAGLLAEFRPLAERMTAEPSRPADSVTDKLLRMADKIVTVRQVGDGSGTDVPGVVGRIETALGRGDLAGAARAWDALPEAQRQLSAAWGAKLKARVAADEAARAVATDALALLDTSRR